MPTFPFLLNKSKSLIDFPSSFSLSLSKSNDALDNINMIGAGYAVGFTLFIGTILFVFLMIAICFHVQRTSDYQHQQSTGTVPVHSINNFHPGIDEATLRQYPKLLYAEAKLHQGNSTSSCCSICLADYNDTDVLRLLPDCSHIFHLKCVDSWLHLHATCPVCRNSPLPEVMVSVDVTSW